jgi:hypothetical protein
LAQTPNHSRLKAVIDEASFEQLLAAACVMQEHNDRLRANDPLAAPSETLSEIVELQGRIQSGSLDFKAAATMIAEELSKNTLASGVAIAILEQDRLAYIAAAGNAAPYIGKQVSREEGPSAECLLSGQIQLCTEAESDGRQPLSFLRRANIRSYIAAPIRRHASVVGALELWFAETGAFLERDIRACELMAVLLSEARAQASPTGIEASWQHERAKAQEGKERPGALLEKFSPEFPPFLATDDFQAALQEQESGTLLEEAASQNPKPSWLSGGESDSAPPLAVESRLAPGGLPQRNDERNAPRNDRRNEDAESSSQPARPGDSAATAKLVCRGCGRRLEGEEAFCGNCGVSRIAAKSEEGYLQHKWATLWYMQEAVRRRELHQENTDSGTSPAIQDPPSENEVRDPSPASDGLRSPSARAWAEQAASKPELLPPLLALKQNSNVKELPPLKAESGREDEERGQEKEPGRAIEPDDDDGVVAEHQDMQTEPASAALWVSKARTPSLDSPPDDEENPESAKTLAEEAPEPDLRPVAKATAEPPSRQTLRTAQLRQRWHDHRATIYLSAAVVLLMAAIFGWGTPAASDRSSSTGRNSAAPQLTAFDKFLIASGLAEAPEQPHEYPGNPDAQVWLDVHTALYYCSGAALYGKTSGGRVASQRSAQLDQFEPDSRKACD